MDKTKLRASILFLLLLLSFAGCGGKNNHSDEPDRAKDLSDFMTWGGSAWETLSMFLTEDRALSFPISCPEGGSMDSDGEALAINNCSINTNGTVYVGNGRYWVTDDVDNVKHSWDQSISINGEEPFHTIGFIQLEKEAPSVSYEFVGEFSSGLHGFSGTLTANEDGTNDATINVSFDGENLLVCEFLHADLGQLTDQQIAEGCGISLDAATRSR